MNQSKLTRSNATPANNNNSQPLVPYHVYNQADFGNPLFNGRDFIYLGILNISFNF